MYAHAYCNQPQVHPVRLDARELKRQNHRYAGTGGVSRHSRSQGFSPAFLDTATGTVYMSRFRDGRPAPVHLLEGLPEELVTARTVGRVVVSARVTAGFVRNGQFYTREQTARAVGGG